MSAFFMTISNCMQQNNLEYFYILTLVDITNTGVIRNYPGQELERNQQRNWETVLQVLGLKAQPTIVTSPIAGEIDADMVERVFGEMHHGKSQKVWAAGFSIEHHDVYLQDGDQLKLLKEDFNQVPVVTNLSETARFILPIFYSYGSLKNIAVYSGVLSSIN